VIAWRRGFFGVWVILACVWIVWTGWYEYIDNDWSTPIQTQDDCWNRLAHWPDGKIIDPFSPEFHAIEPKIRECQTATWKDTTEPCKFVKPDCSTSALGFASIALQFR
jgi:hypothetical protein